MNAAPRTTLRKTTAIFCAMALCAGSAMADPRRGDGDGRRAEGPRGDARHAEFQRGSRRADSPPARWVDRGHGHNHVYPSVGARVRVLPSTYRPVVWGGVSYRWHDNVWYGPGPRGWVVVRPPYGAVIPWRPALFTVVTVAGLAYLYANGTYYREYPGGGYEVVPPPAAPAPAVLEGVPPTFVYPRQGQGAQQQASDEYECHRWAVGQTGFDPTEAAMGQGSGSARAGDYQRARTACLDARGYTVR